MVLNRWWILVVPEVRYGVLFKNLSILEVSPRLLPRPRYFDFSMGTILLRVKVREPSSSVEGKIKEVPRVAAAPIATRNLESRNPEPRATRSDWFGKSAFLVTKSAPPPLLQKRRKNSKGFRASLQHPRKRESYLGRIGLKR